MLSFEDEQTSIYVWLKVSELKKNPLTPKSKKVFGNMTPYQNVDLRKIRERDGHAQISE